MPALPGVIDEYLDSHDDDLLEEALALVGFDSQNPPGETHELFEYLERRLSDAGSDPAMVATDPARPNLLVTVPGEREETLLYNGHLDTVPFDDAEWDHDPLGELVDASGEVVEVGIGAEGGAEGGEDPETRLYGRGATDMQGAVAAMVLVASAFVETGTTPPVTLAFTLVSGEETGDEAGLPALLDRGLSADACVIGETTCEGGRHSVTVADTGSIWLTLAADGVGAHGSRPALGVNAIDRLYVAVEAVRDELADEALDVDPVLDEVIAESVAFYAPQMGERAARETFRRPTVNLGVLRGGTAINTVPDRAVARLDVRVAPSVHTPDVLADVERVLADQEGVEITSRNWSVGTFEAPDSPIVAATTEAAAAATSDRVYRRSATGGGDAKKLRNAGVPTVEFGVGTDSAHAADEYTTVGALRTNAAVYARLPYALAAALDAREEDR